MDAFIDLLKVLSRQPSVVGAEHAFFRALQRELEERGAKVTWYEGLLVAEGDDPTSASFSAHVDRHGLVCTGPNEFQYAAFVAAHRSDLLGNSVSERMMRKVAGRFADVAVSAYEPWSGAYLGTGRVRATSICEMRNNLIFEVDGLDHLVAGTPVAFVDRLRAENGTLTGQLDNVLTVALLVRLFELGFRGTAFFTAQEECGRSWRYLLEWFRRFGGKTSSLIVVDTSPYPDDDPEARPQIVLRRRDANAAFDPATTERLAGLCESFGLTYHFKDEWVESVNRRLGKETTSLGSTELGRIVAASNGLVGGTTLQVPTVGYHTVAESVATSSCEAFLRLARALSA